MGILVNESQIGGGASNSSHNIGDIFYTTRTDNSLNGAVECNGSQYNFSDFDSNLQSLFDEGKLPYIPIGDFDEMVTNQGGCDSFGYGISDSSVVEIYAWGAAYSISPYPETVYTTTDNPVEEDTVYELSNGVITELGTVAIKQSSTTIRIRFKNGTEIAGWNRQTGSDTTAELVQPFSPTTYFKVPKKLSRVLVRCKKPTEDDKSWYNVYADGWVEQGGVSTVSSGTGQIIFRDTLQVQLQNNIEYFISSSFNWGSGPSRAIVNSYLTSNNGKTINIVAETLNQSTTTGTGKFIWEVKGYAAPSEYTKDKWDYQNVQVERPMIQLFNSTTDTAVATCNQVLADVSALNQGDYVIATQIPTPENNYSWYRLYKSGWVEQGGYVSYTGSWTEVHIDSVELPIEFANTDYRIMIGRTQPADGDVLTSYDVNKTTTGFGISSYAVNQSTAVASNWFAVGMSAKGNN